MELSPSVLQGLEAAGSSTLTDGTFKLLATSAAQGALGKDGISEKLRDDGKLDQALAKEAYASLMTLFLEAGRTDANTDTISTVLEDCGYPPERTQVLCKLYTEHRAQLRANLARVASTLPHVVDVQWRLDYFLKGNRLERVNIPVYLIDLKTEQNDQAGVETIQFACTQEQLQDLVTKLRDASKGLERLTQQQ